MSVPRVHRRQVAAKREAKLPSIEPTIEEVVDALASEVNWEDAMPSRARFASWRRRQAIKRSIDIVLAVLGLVLLSPLLLIVALAVAAESRGSIFYPWVVVGYRGRRFIGYKFRTMVSDADRLKDDLQHLNEMSGPVFKIRNDPRITRLGRFLRKYSIDELPQLWSVLKGDMSLVGPRPLGLREFIDCRLDQRRKLSVRPGITCLWQVNGRSSITEFEEWIRLDLLYIREWSLKQDVQILARTALVVLRGRDAY